MPDKLEQELAGLQEEESSQPIPICNDDVGTLTEQNGTENQEPELEEAAPTNYPEPQDTVFITTAVDFDDQAPPTISRSKKKLQCDGPARTCKPRSNYKIQIPPLTHVNRLPKTVFDYYLQFGYAPITINALLHYPVQKLTNKTVSFVTTLPPKHC